MAESAAFTLACEVLERETSLDRLEARGTVRLALKEAGLEARHVSPDQMVVVVAKLLPHELEARGVEGGDGVCATLGERLAQLESGQTGDTPEAVFSRLGG